MANTPFGVLSLGQYSESMRLIFHLDMDTTLFREPTALHPNSGSLSQIRQMYNVQIHLFLHPKSDEHHKVRDIN